MMPGVCVTFYSDNVIHKMTPTFTSFSNPGCQDVDRDPDPESQGYNHAIVAHLGYLMRYIDFGDTLFFILRKKFDNVSALQGSTINKILARRNWAWDL